MIRFATMDDVLRINVLRKQVNDLHSEGRPDIFKKGFGAELAAMTETFIKQDDTAVIVCEREEEILGFAMLHERHRPETPYGVARDYLEVEEFGVDSAVQRQGIGQELMDWIKKHAAERGFKRVELNMWSFNAGALAFYEHEGFNTYRRYLEWFVDE